MPKEQTITAKGGETLKFGDVTVDVALAHHSTPVAGIQEALANLYKLEYGPELAGGGDRSRRQCARAARSRRR